MFLKPAWSRLGMLMETDLLGSHRNIWSPYWKPASQSLTWLQHHLGIMKNTCLQRPNSSPWYTEKQSADYRRCYWSHSDKDLRKLTDLYCRISITNPDNQYTKAHLHSLVMVCFVCLSNTFLSLYELIIFMLSYPIPMFYYLTQSPSSTGFKNTNK